MICRGAEILKVRVEGVPLGLLDSREYQEVTFETEPGDVIVLYSDGITDHMDAAGAEYGRGRLANFVRANCWRSPDDLIQAIFDDVDRFALQAFDDQTLFAMRTI
jgi:phosphoserine phosphatase RsbU/P